ncbi:MAG: S9 family peptidase [Enhygromyxa sp.]
MPRRQSLRAAAAACLSLAVLLAACRASRARLADPVVHAALQPPIAKIVPHLLEAHGHIRIDNYYWMHDTDDPELIAYLEAENAYTEATTAGTEPLRATLLAEMTGRIEQADFTVPYRVRDYYYYQRWEEGADYPLYARKQGSLDASEEIILDAQALAEGHDYFDVRALAVSESQQLLAYSTDTLGRRIHTIYIKDLRTGELLPDLIPEVTGSLVWANDDRTLFYTKQDPQTLREHRVHRHTLGDDPSADALVYEESDETFEVGIGKTTSREYVIIHSYQTLGDEVRLLDADAPDSAPWLVQPRERGLEYEVDHANDTLYIRTNLDAPNFRLVEAPVEQPGKQNWRERIGHREQVLLEDFELFADHLVLVARRAGLIEFEVHPRAEGEPYTIEFPEPTYLAYPEDNLEFESSSFRFVYESLTTPPRVYDLDLDSRAQVLRKQTRVLGGFDPDDYASERLWAPARDGVEVPISLVYRECGGGSGRCGPAPLLLYGYGAYGHSSEAYFDSELLSLLDRGFVFAIAHVRGGEELGRDWYEQGKLFTKKNSFTDFIDCAEFLRAQGYADPERMFALGASAGGLLVGAVINLRPDLFRGVVAQVPFVDLVTTMLDPSTPLTTVEYDEWGNPHREADYRYMLSYSPYDNVEPKPYPALLVTAGLHDSQVQIWEPAKWVAKLRALATGDNPLLLRVDMSAGHRGQAGRLASLEQIAFEYGFLLDLL